MRIDRARHGADLLEQEARDRHVGDRVVALQLHVDRRRLPEVEDLRDDVGWLEEELDAGEALRQDPAQRLDVAVRGRVAFLQRDHDFAVEGADRAGIAVGQVDPARGQAEVVDDGVELVGQHYLAHHLLDLVSQARGFLDADAGLGAHVQADVAGIDIREEVAAERKDQPGRQQAETEEGDRGHPAAHDQHA